MMKKIFLLGFLTLAACQPGSSPSAGLSLKRALSADELRSDADQRLSKMLAEGGSANQLFLVYNPGGISRWASGWTRGFDLTGVAWNNKRSGTAITPRHVVYAAHYSYKPGAKLVFHDRSGKPHVRTLVAQSGRIVTASGWKTDINVGLLDRPLPSAVKTYRLLPPRADYPDILPGCPVLVTEQDRTLRIHQVRAQSIAGISFAKNPRVSDLQYKSLVVGDSGNPSFLIVGGEPVLIETHTGGGPGSGPFYSEPAVFAALQQAVARLDNHFQIRTVPLDPAPISKKATPPPALSPARPVPNPVIPPPGTPNQPRVRRVPVEN